MPVMIRSCAAVTSDSASPNPAPDESPGAAAASAAVPPARASAAADPPATVAADAPAVVPPAIPDDSGAAVLTTAAGRVSATAGPPADPAADSDTCPPHPVAASIITRPATAIRATMPRPNLVPRPNRYIPRAFNSRCLHRKFRIALPESTPPTRPAD